MQEFKDITSYDFTDAPADIKSLIHCINLQGKNLVGLELGVFRGVSFCTVLQNCPNIKTLHGVDSWKPYKDYLKDPYDDKSWAYEMDQKEIEYIKFQALHTIKYSGYQNKAVIHEKDSNEALQEFEDNSLDFIFIDTFLSYEQAVNDIKNWYPKVKQGGLFAGHDWHVSVIKRAVNDFRENNNIDSTLSSFDKCWVWKKY